MPIPRLPSGGWKRFLDDLWESASPGITKREHVLDPDLGIDVARGREPTDPRQLITSKGRITKHRRHRESQLDPEEAAFLREELEAQDQILSTIPKLRAGGAAAGGVGGYASGDDEADRWRNALAGAFVGGVVLPKLPCSGRLTPTGSPTTCSTPISPPLTP